MAIETEISEILHEIVHICDSVSGINFAPTNPPDQASQSPFAIVYMSGGTASIKAGASVAHHTEVTIQAGLPLREMARANEVILPLGQDLILALFQGLKDGDINPQNFDSMRYLYGPFVWGGVQMFGWTITIENLLTIEALT